MTACINWRLTTDLRKVFVAFQFITVPPIADTAIPDGLSVTKFFLSAFQIICLVEVPFDSAPVTRVNWIRADNMAEVSFDPASPVRQSFSMATPSQYNLSLIFDSFLPNQTGVYDCVSLNEGGTSSSSIDVEIQLPGRCTGVNTALARWGPADARCSGHKHVYWHAPCWH